MPKLSPMLPGSLLARATAGSIPPNSSTASRRLRRASPTGSCRRNEAAAAILRTRTLTKLYNTRGKPEGAWLDALHRALDAAVAAAYGWPDDIADDEVLARLLALNHAREPA